MIKLYLAAGFLTLFSFTNFSQEEEEVNEACNPPQKKTIKLIENANNSESIQAAVDNFNKAMEAEPENATAYYEYAVYAYNQGMDYLKTDLTGEKSNRSFKKSEEMFQQVLEICEEYNAGTYYYLGVIKYMQRDNELAKEYLLKFKAYKNMDNNRFPNDYGNMIKNANGVLKKWETEGSVVKVEIAEVPFKPFRVQNVSSKDNEYFPMISPDNELMFYTRKVDRKLLGDMMTNWQEEFTFSQREGMSNSFDKGNPFKAPFNTGDFSSYGAATMSIDNKEMIICACKKEVVRGQDYLNCDLYSTTYSQSGKSGDGYNWTTLQTLGSNVNSIDGWEGQPSISADGSTLYFSSSRKDSRNNDNDIYISERKADGTWGLARPFDEINTDGKDKSPFIHQDNETFYFVSECTDKRPGAGGLDIFYIKKVNGKWSKPVNIGVPINTAGDELGLFVSTDGELAYYSSNQGGDYNIFGFELYKDARPTPVMIMKGTLTDNKGKTVSGAEIEISYGDSDEVQKVKVNGDDGKYAAAIKMDPTKDVLVSAKKEGAAFAAKLITKEEIQAQKTKKEVSVKGKDMEVSKVEIGGAYVIDDILYTTASADLSQRSKVMLKQFARYLQDNPTMKIVIQGHTDDVGDEEKNLELSAERAKVVKDYLVSQGINGGRLTSKGLGETQPKIENDSEEARAKNRRTEFKIVAL
jgi:outer membrane protein OmpA-like peptidoglycan-associated protein/tetratricopeptide (TPR) repeat protein